MDGGENGASVAVEPPGGVAIADILDDISDNVRDFDVRFGRNLTGDECDSGGQYGLAGYAAVFVLCDHGVQNSVGNLVGDFIRMPFGHRFGRKEVIVSHCHSSNGSAGDGCSISVGGNGPV